MRARALLENRLLVGVLTLALAPAAIAATPASAAAASTAAAAQATTAVSIDNQSQPTHLPIKPHGYYSHTALANLTWSNWGQPTATAHGSFIFQFCVEESCSVSPFYSEPVVVTLSAIQRCHARLAYTVLALDVEAELPDSSFKGYRTSVAACASTHSHSAHSHARRKHS
jgi:hypothetical protein